MGNTRSALDSLIGGRDAGAVRAAAAAGDVETVRQIVQPAMKPSAASWKRRAIISALAALLPGVAVHTWAPLPYSDAATEVAALGNLDVVSAYNADVATRERMVPIAYFPELRGADARGRGPDPDPDINSAWVALERHVPTAASVGSLGVPESPSHLLKRLTAYRKQMAEDDFPEADTVRDLAAAVQFWNRYWQERYAPLLRWLQSSAARSPLDSMSADDASRAGVGDAWRSRRAFRASTNKAVDRHFAFFEKLKDAVADTPLEALLSAYSGRRSEEALALLPGPGPSIARFVDPSFPVVNPSLPRSIEHPAAAVLSNVHRGVVRETKPILSGHLSLKSGRDRAFLCGALADYCGEEVPTDRKAALVRRAWDTYLYTSKTAPLRQALSEIHGSGPVYLADGLSELRFVIREDAEGEPSAVLSGNRAHIHFHGENLGYSAEHMVADTLNKAFAREGAAGLSKVVINCGRYAQEHGQTDWTAGHAIVLIIDLVANKVQLFDPHGRLWARFKKQAPLLDAELARVFSTPRVREALRGHTVTVGSSLESALIAKELRDSQGPQLWHQHVSTSHEGSCVLWSLWLSHVVAQNPTLSPSAALAAGLANILEQDDVDVATRNSVFGRRGSKKLTTAQGVRVGEALHRFIHKFTTQLLSLIPEEELFSWEPLMATLQKDTEPTNFAALNRIYDSWMTEGGLVADAAPADPTEKGKWMLALYRASVLSRPEELTFMKALLPTLFRGGKMDSHTTAIWSDMVGSLEPFISRADKGVPPSTFLKAGTAPTDIQASARAALALLERIAKTPDPSVLHRLWRLRQGFLSPEHVAAASEEAFGTRRPPSGKVLRFLQATEFLQDLVDGGMGLGPVSTDQGSSAGEGVWRRLWRKTADVLWDKAGDSFRGDVPSGTYS